MLVLMIVLPCLVIGAAAVVVLDRMGVLSGWESGSAAGAGGGSFLERVPRAGLLLGMAAMALWILAWLVVLVVGISVLAG